MGSKQLANLEILSDRRAAQSGQQVNRLRADVDRLIRQRDELRAINQEYQKVSENEALVAPTMLAHRRTFVTRLTEKLDRINAQRARQNKILEQREAEHQLRTAQNLALSTVRETAEQEERIMADRREQRTNEDSFRAASNGGIHAERDGDND
jgi:flagellar biosynthesis chaperone FliJ